MSDTGDTSDMLRHGRRRLLAQAAAAWAAAGAPWAGLGTTLAAEPGVDAPPEPLPPRPVLLPPMPLHRLGNGLTVVTVPRHDVRVVSAQLLLKVGAESDPAGRPGVASMTATLLAKGALRQGRPVPATALAREAEALGGALATDSDWRSFGVGMTVLAPKLPAALALMADTLRQPVLAAEELERARAQALDSLRVAMSSPAEVANMALRRAFWGAAAYGAVTPPAALQRLARADVLHFHRLHARPELDVLVLAGDITTERAAQLAQAQLGDWQASGALLPLPPTTAPQPQAPPLVLLDMPGSGQCSVALAAPFVAAGAADRRIGQVANAVLGGGYSARLNQQVRIRRGLSYGAFSTAESYPPGGMLVARSQTQHASAAQVLQLMRDEVQRMAEQPPTPAELAARQATMVGSFARQLQTTGGLASLAAAQLVAGRPLQDLQRYVAEVLAVTPEQVQAFARQHWAPERLRAVVVGDLAAAGEGLSASAQPQALRLTLDTLDLEQPGLVAPR